MKSALDAPAGITILDSIKTSRGSPFERVIIAPPLDAGLLKVTLPSENPNPRIVDGVSSIDLRPAGKTVIVVCKLMPSKPAEIVTGVDAVTGLVVIVNVALVSPPGMVTDAGTAATAGLLLDNATITPFDGAAPLRVMVPDVALPPVTLGGSSVADVTAGGRTVNVADCVTPANEPEIGTCVDAETGVVMMLKVALVAPAGIVTDAATAATDPLPLDSVMTAPLAGAAALSVTVPVDGPPPVTLVGLKDTDARAVFVPRLKTTSLLLPASQTI